MSNEFARIVQEMSTFDKSRNNLLSSMHKRIMQLQPERSISGSGESMQIIVRNQRDWDDVVLEIMEGNLVSKWLSTERLLAVGNALRELEITSLEEVYKLLGGSSKPIPPKILLSELTSVFTVIVMRKTETSGKKKKTLFVSNDCAYLCRNSATEKIINFLDGEINKVIDEVILAAVLKYMPDFSEAEVQQLIDEISEEVEALEEDVSTPNMQPYLDGFGILELQDLDTPQLLDSVSEFDADKLPADTELDNIDQLPNPRPPGRGRQPYHKKYPALVSTVQHFLESVGFEAQRRRRTDVGVALGLGSFLKQLKIHVEKEIAGLIIS